MLQKKINCRFKRRNNLVLQTADVVCLQCKTLFFGKHDKLKVKYSFVSKLKP